MAGLFSGFLVEKCVACQNSVVRFWMASFSFFTLLNPLSPNIHIQILQTDLHTFPLRITWENLIEHQGIFSFLIIFFIFSQPYLLTMYGHCWEKIAVGHYWDLKGLMRKRV